jgi:putative transposase
VTKSRKIRLYPTASQRATFRKWFGASRYVYNQTIDYIHKLDGPRPHWMALFKIIRDALPTWADEIPFQIKKIAVKDASEAFSAAKIRTKRTGEPFSMKFRSRKDIQQSCFLPGSAIQRAGLYPTISGKGLHYAESLPEHGDGRLLYRQGRWYVALSYKQTMPKSEKQARMVALDPGVRTFQTFFSPDMAGAIGLHDFGRIARLCLHLDDLLSRIATCPDKKRRYRMRRAANRMRWKIRDLRDELHWKTARFLVDNFDIILLPTFETSQMVTKTARKIRSKTVRAMLTYAHFEFKQRLKALAIQAGKIVLDVCEAYTSKTCSWSGQRVNVGSSETIRGSDGIRMHRDANGARGIFLRALGELPALETIQRALVNDAGDLSAFSS